MAKKLKPNVSQKIYAAFLTHCQPATLPAPWEGLTVHASCVCCPTEQEAALADLQQRFERRDLLGSKVVVRTKAGDLRLNRVLRRPTDYVVALRKRANAAPFDLVTADGCISQSRWPAIACLEDQSIRDALSDFEQCLLICFTMVELVVCRSMGLPASLSVGLDDESMDLLDELAPRCGWDSRERDLYLGKITEEQLEAEAAEYKTLETRLAESMAVAEAEATQDAVDVTNADEDGLFESSEIAASEAANNEVDGTTEDSAIQQNKHSDVETAQATDFVSQKYKSPSLELTILGWQISTMSQEEPAELESMIGHLRDVDQYLGIEFGDSIIIWTPKPSSLRLIEKRLEHGALPGAVAAVLESYAEEGWDLQRYGDVTHQPPSNFAEAVAHLRKAFRGEAVGLDRQEEKIKKALAWFEKYLDSDVVNPMLNEAVAASDPIRKSNLLVAAELGRMLHRETAIIDYCMERAAALAIENHNVPAEIPNAKILLALVDRMLKVCQELTR